MATKSVEQTGESDVAAAGTVCAAFQSTASASPTRVALRTKGDESRVTWSDYAERVRRLAAGLASLGVKRGEAVGLMLSNRPEFHVADAAVMHLGGTPFSIYNTYTAEQIEYLVGDAGCRVLITERLFFDTIAAVQGASSGVEHVVLVDDAMEGALSLADVEAGADPAFDFEAAWQAVQPDDLVTLIYTSGTTGPPKGVELTHANVTSVVRALDEVIRLPDAAQVVSYLPMAHIAERVCTHYLPIAHGFTTTCCPDPREVAGYLPEVRPHWFFSPPRIWEKLKAALELAIASEADESRRTAMERALELGKQKVRAEQAGETLPQELLDEYAKADELILSALRARVGFDRLSSALVGAAPCAPDVIEFFHALGVRLIEGWGMSECSGVGTINPPERIKIGTVGPPIPGTEISLADDGEILVRSPLVMAGYRNQPDKTKETIDDKGWLHTGDIGEIDEDGYVKIVDRKKEIIINAAGKNMSPANIESTLKASSQLIGQACVIGDRRPYNVALITLDPDVAPAFAARHGIADTSPEALATADAIVESVREGVELANSRLARVEQIKRFKILPTDWEPAGDELTPTMKLKRKPIAQKYAREIEELYSA